MIRHDQARELSAAALDFPLAPAEADALAQHLAGCAECRAFSAALGRDAGAILGLPAVHAPDALRNATLWHATRPAARGRGLRLIGLLAAVLVLVVGGGALAGSLLRDNREVVLDPSASATLGPDDEVVETPTSSPSPTATATATSTSTASPTPMPSSSPTAAPTLVELQEVEAQVWVEVITDQLNIRSAVGTSSPILGTLERGDLAFSGAAADRVSRDGFDWTYLSVPGGPSGWTAFRSDTEAFLSSDDVNGTVEFCATPVRRPFAFDGTHPMPLAATIDFPGFEGILPTDIFSIEGLAVADLAWGESDEEVCVSVEIVRSRADSGRMSGDFIACGRPDAGAIEYYLRYEPETSLDVRSAGIHDVLFGYADVFRRGNLDNLLLLAGAGQGYASRAIACVDVAVSGGKDDSTVSAVFSARGCARVVSVDEEAVVLHGVAPWTAEDRTFILHPGSTVAPEITPGATLGVSLEGDRGIDGPIRIGTAPVSGCD